MNSASPPAKTRTLSKDVAQTATKIHFLSFVGLREPPVEDRDLVSDRDALQAMTNSAVVVDEVLRGHVLLHGQEDFIANHHIFALCFDDFHIMIVINATCLEEVILQGFQGDGVATVFCNFETAVLVALVVADLVGGAVLSSL